MSLDGLFKLKEHNTTVSREIVGGLTTFMALSYIIFVQPVVLSSTGMDPSAVMFATCVCSALACFIMGLWANLPIALAPAMGHNFFFAFTVCGAVAAGGFGLSWQQALAANFIAGCLFLIMSLFGLRQVIMNAIPTGLKYAIAAGIGLLIAFIGLQWSGIVVAKNGVYVGLGNLRQPVVLLSIFGLLVIAVLSAYRIKAAIFLGMLATVVAGYFWSKFTDVSLISTAAVTEFPNVSATAGQIFPAFGGLLGQGWGTVAVIVFTFLLLDVFDTIGTIVAVTERAGLMKDGQLPQARQAMVADAVGTISGTVMGTSTITSYVESCAGVAAGARTGLAAVVTGIAFLVAIFAYPFVGVFSSDVSVSLAQLGSDTQNAIPFFNSTSCYPVIAPVLIVIGCYMLPMVRKINWEDFSEALPAFLTFVVMQFSLSITDGIAWGFISYALLKLLTGKPRQCPVVVYVCSVFFILHYIL